MIQIAAQHERHGLVIGTLEVVTLPDDIVFVLKANTMLTPDNHRFTIEQPTLSELVAEADNQGLSDIGPLGTL